MTGNDKILLMGKALMVVALDRKIRRFLQDNDPMALKQVEDAIENGIADFPDLMGVAKPYFENKPRISECPNDSVEWTTHSGRWVPAKGADARVQLSLAKAKRARFEADGDAAGAEETRLDIEAMEDYLKTKLPPLFHEKLREENGELLCNCGNRPDLDGFHPCNPDGKWCEPVPGEWHNACLLKCAKCGVIVSSLPETFGMVIQTGATNKNLCDEYEGI